MLPVAPDRPAQRDRQGPGTRPRLEHPSAGEDVGVRDDRPEVLGIDHLRAPLHLQGEVGEARPERRHDHAAGRLRARALGLAEQAGRAASVPECVWYVPPACSRNRYVRSR